jgi:phosphatidate cytidylyltransferase
MLRTRIITALMLGSLLLGVLLLGPAWLSRVLIGLFLAAGAWEWSAFLTAAPHWARLGFVVLVALLSLAARIWLADAAAFTLLMEASVAWWLVALAWLLLWPQRANAWAVAAAGLFALVPTWVALVRMIELWPRGAQWALFVMALAFAADTGAYFIGRFFGRVKLAPQVSPGKTWEGVFGGLLLALGVAYGGGRWFGVPLVQFMPLCLAGAAFSVVGDLTESMFKRASGMKDSGRLFPGHGGVLDRIDSVLACTPVICAGLMWMGVTA